MNSTKRWISAGLVACLLMVLGVFGSASAFADDDPSATVATDQATEPAPEVAPAASDPAPAPEAPAPAAEPEAVVPDPAPEAVVPDAPAVEDPSAPAPEQESRQQQPKKVWVCKYVGKPGLDERLKDGKNPLSVSENSLPNGFHGNFPYPFADAQDHSIAVAWDTGQQSVQCPKADNPDFVTVAWRMPTWPGPSWDQTYQSSQKTDVPQLDVLDNSLPTGCYQIDVYYDNQTTTNLIAGKILHGPGNPPESLIPGGLNTAWKFKKVGNWCNTTPVTAQFDITPTPPTCSAAGALSTTVFPIDRTGYTLSISPAYTGAGTYTITATAKDGFVLQGDVSKQVTVLGATGYQNTDPRKPCFQLVKVNPEPPVWTDECGLDNGAWTPPAETVGYHYVLTSFGKFRFATLVVEPGYVVDIFHTTFIYKDSDDGILCAVPVKPAKDDQCLWANDSLVLPENGNGVTYSYDGKDVVATLADGYEWDVANIPGFWHANENGTYTFEFNRKHFTSEDCVTGVPTVFDSGPTPPTCTEAGSLGLDADLFPNLFVVVFPHYDGPGTYKVVVVTRPGYVFPDGTHIKTKWVTVKGAIGFQSTNSEAPCFQAPPIVVTLGQPVFNDVCGTENDYGDLPANTEGITYRWQSGDETNFNFEAILDAGYVAAVPLPEGWTRIDTNAFLYTWDPVFTDTPCPVTSTPVTPVTEVLAAPPIPPTAHAVLASTGSNDTAVLGGLAAALLLSGAGAVVLATRRRSTTK